MVSVENLAGGRPLHGHDEVIAGVWDCGDSDTRQYVVGVVLWIVGQVLKPTPHILCGGLCHSFTGSNWMPAASDSTSR